MIKLLRPWMQKSARYIFFTSIALICSFDKSGVLLATMTAAFLHEAGHIITIFLISGRWPRRISFTGLGFTISENEVILMKNTSQMLVYLSGPVFNIITFAFFFRPENSFLQMLSQASISLAIFNLLPVGHLDGGNALRVIIGCFTNEARVGIYSDAVSVIVLFPLSVAGFVHAFRTYNDYSLLILACYLLISVTLERYNKN